MKTLLLHLSLVFCALSSLQSRTWTEAQTGRTLEGEFENVQGSAVVVRTGNGGTLQLPLARLSEADQSFVKEQAAAAHAGQESGSRRMLRMYCARR